ncbi:hypothetical protein Tco_1167935 [Tanacetum coccineum]
MVVKMSISIQAMFMLGLKPNSFYDPNLKNSLGYQNPFTLKKEIYLNPKLYDALYLHNLKVRVDVCDTEEILEDATKSQLKMKRKLDDPTAIEKRVKFFPANYTKMNYLYETFVSQVELSLEQKYFSEASTFNVTHVTENIIKQKEFPEDVQVMMNIFELIESELYETLKQNELLNGRLLEAMKHILNVEIKKVKSKSKDVQENLLKRIKILENDFQRCQVQSIDFELQLQYQKEKTDCEQSLKNLCENSWISKMEKLENENVSLEFQVQYLNKELEHVKLVYHKLFDSIKKIRSQTQKQVNELIESVNQKTYAYGDVIQIVLWIVDSGCSKHMTGLGHNLFSVGEFCDGDLKVAFRSKMYYVCNLEGDD